MIAGLFILAVIILSQLGNHYALDEMERQERRAAARRARRSGCVSR